MRIRVLALLPATLLITACGTYADTAGDQAAVHETGSQLIPTDRVIVEDCVEPSKNQRIGYGDTAYYYPAGGRTWEFSAAEDADNPPITVAVGSPPQQVQFTGVLSFSLKTDCVTLNAFHQAQGRKDWSGGHAAYINDGNYSGWAAMLRSLVGASVKTTLAAKAQDDSVLALYNTETARNTLAENILESMPAEVKEVAGGDYFALNGLQIISATPPQATLDALDRQATATQNKLAAEAENETNQQRYDTVVDCLNSGITEDACILLYGINSGKVPYLAPDGSIVQLPVPAP